MAAVIVNNKIDEVAGSLPVQIEFGGGIELLFSKTKSTSLNLPLVNKTQWNIQDIIYWLRDNLLKERPELFLQDNSVRPGILVLINEADWELMDTVNYVIQPNDKITFISTLHGG